MDTKSGPNGYEACKGRKDTLSVWRLIESTHLTGSSRSKQAHLISFLGLKQTGSHESFMYDFNRLAELVEHHCDSKLHPGFISFADLKKAMYLSNCDQDFFSRHIDRELEEPKEGTTVLQLMEVFQAFAFEKGGDSSQKSTAFAGRALAATVDIVSTQSGKSKRGPYSCSIHHSVWHISTSRYRFFHGICILSSIR